MCGSIVAHMLKDHEIALSLCGNVSEFRRVYESMQQVPNENYYSKPLLGSLRRLKKNCIICYLNLMAEKCISETFNFVKFIYLEFKTFR